MKHGRRLTIRFPREHPGPAVGEVLESNGGTWYLVTHARRVEHRDPQPPDQAWALECVPVRRDQRAPDHTFTWDKRG